MFSERTSTGLDVHARSVVAAAIDTSTGELSQSGGLRVVPRAVMAAAAVIQGSRGGVSLPSKDLDRVKSHLAKRYRKMDDTPPWERD